MIKFKPRQGSLFAVLLRSPWWVSMLIACALFGIARFFLPTPLAIATTLPFLGLAGYVGWRAMQVPSAGRVKALLESLRTMPWEQFSTVMTDAFQREGYQVAPLKHGRADLELRKSGYVSLVSCKRWKVAQTGIAPLRELMEEQKSRDARDCTYVTVGDFTATARAFAMENGIRMLHDVELAKFIGSVKRASRMQPVRP